jgi:hypothetical protein
MDKFVLNESSGSDSTKLLPLMPSREELINLGVSEIYANTLLPETVAAMVEIIKNNRHFDVQKSQWSLTNVGVTLDLRTIGNALGLRVNKGSERVPFDCYDYVFRRGKAKSASVISGPACKSEITVVTTANCKTTKKALYTLRLEPGLKKMLFDESNDRITNIADRQRLLNARRWYKVADSLDLGNYFFAGRKAFDALKQCSTVDGDVVYEVIMHDTFIPPTNERAPSEAKPEEPDSVTVPAVATTPTAELSPVVAEVPELPRFDELEEDFDTWLAGIVPSGFENLDAVSLF